jgi:protein-S-isoprenylcysteine O-methyltransferase Ste14
MRYVIDFIRHLLSFLILPFTMTVLIPTWIARRNHVMFRWPANAFELGLFGAGAVVLAIGLTLFVASLYEFVTRGRGTLAPWDPPRKLVVHGPYRYVRNPMISGVIFVICGEALLLRSRSIGEWAALFAVINLIYIPLLEEPQLAQRFGDAYDEYRRHVPRIIPRLRPWHADATVD